ncbi:ABC transporter ATP-binding protein [Actinomadura sp. 3N508]|uniref:ABC transporter ATP-binding protein n=1 Tax=Actinomadura sp. 3N508 TaxID=3375153 RepID=UPI00379ACBA8
MTLLDVDDITVRFGGLAAVSELSLSVPAGIIMGIIGPNGAGKTTLFNVIAGIQAPTAGRVTLAGRDVTSMPPHRRARRGLARTFQRLEVFGTLTVRENILVAADARRRWERGVSPRAVADELLERTRLSEVASATVDALPTGTQRLVELARALAAGPKLLLLDEASSGLSSYDSDRISALLRELVDSDGLTIVLVEHDMPFVMGLSDRVAMLDHGRLVAQGTPAEIQEMPAVQEAYLGVRR